METRALLHRVERAHGGALLLGHGLGAVYRVPPPGNGVAPPGHPVSYVHNFYLFLLFKLGLVGTVLVIASLALFTTSPLLRLLRGAGTGSRPILAVALATWVGYAVWSAACPMILDFHVAPLLGLVVAAASRPAAGGQVGAEVRETDFRPPHEPHVLP